MQYIYLENKQQKVLTLIYLNFYVFSISLTVHLSFSIFIKTSGNKVI